jgi:hypothetical protein
MCHMKRKSARFLSVWRIVISPMIPQDFPSYYHSTMRHLVVLLIHFLATLVRLIAPGGVLRREIMLPRMSGVPFARFAMPIFRNIAISQQRCGRGVILKRCEVETTFYFANVNDKTVRQTLAALRTQSAVAHFIEQNQEKRGAELQKAFVRFLASLRLREQPNSGARALKALDR